MSSNEERAARFAAAVLQRRTELAKSQLDVWRSGGPSNSTLTTLENGRGELTNATAKKLDKALEWEPGSALRLWREGVEPTPKRRVASIKRPPAIDPSPGLPAGRSFEQLEDLVMDLNERVMALEYQVAVLTSPGAEAARDVGRRGSVRRVRDAQDQAGEPPVDDTDDMEPR